MTFNARQSVRDQYLPYFATSLAYSEPDPTLPKATLYYDPLARSVRTVNPDGTYSSITYGPLTQIHFDEEDNTPSSPHANTPTTFSFDGLERLISTEEVNLVDGQSERYLTRYDYDRLGNLVKLTDAQDNVKTMTYDALGRKLHMVDPDKGEMHYTYDDAGNLFVTRDAIGQRLCAPMTPPTGLLEEKWVFNNGQADVVNARYHYDGDLSPLHPDAQNTLGQTAYIEDQAGSVHFSYDPRGNVIGSVRRFEAEKLALVTRLEYDAMDRLVQAIFPDGSTVDYEYNERGLLARHTGLCRSGQYLPTEQRASIRYSNGVRHRLWLRCPATATAATDCQQRQGVARPDLYAGQGQQCALDQRRPAGPRARTAQNDQTQSFVYDALYRMVQAQGTYGQIDFGYDHIGNMVRKTSTAPDPRLNLGELRYGENGAGPHALTSANGESWSYDANGNLRQKGQTTYGWDARDQLTAIDDGALYSTFVYDASGQRVQQTVRQGDAITTTLYAGQYAEIRGDELIFYVFDEQNRVAQVTKPFDRTQLLTGFGRENNSQFAALWAHNSQFPVHWYVADHLGGTSLLLDKTGNVASEVAYYPFGLTRYEHNGDRVHYRFTGQEQDASGLMYYNARYYEPVTGRFISVDPLFVESPLKGARTRNCSTSMPMLSTTQHATPIRMAPSRKRWRR